MKLFELFAELNLNKDGFDKGINEAGKQGEAFQGKVSAMTIATGQMLAQVAQQAASAIAGMYGQAIGSFADYEQLVGGIETLFGASAGKMQQYASQAYKTAGLSANQYMETATAFSASLIQGLRKHAKKGEDVMSKAADVTNMAMIDMADNANKMGTDMQAIQNAYQGFSKGNFTINCRLSIA